MSKPLSICMPVDLKEALDAHIADQQATAPVGANINRNSWIVDTIRRALAATSTTPPTLTDARVSK